MQSKHQNFWWTRDCIPPADIVVLLLFSLPSLQGGNVPLQAVG